MANGNGRRKGVLQTYRSYHFVDKDPVIDELRTVFKDEGMMKPGGLNKVHVLSGVSVAAMHGWFYGKTKRPQSATLEAAARALGYKRVFQQVREVNIEASFKRLKALEDAAD